MRKFRFVELVRSKMNEHIVNEPESVGDKNAHTTPLQKAKKSLRPPYIIPVDRSSTILEKHSSGVVSSTAVNVSRHHDEIKPARKA